MAHSIVHIADLTRADVIDLLARAEFLRTQPSTLPGGKVVGLVLPDDTSAPGNPGDILRSAGFAIGKVSVQDLELSPSELAGLISDLNADVVVGSLPTSESATTIVKLINAPYLSLGDGANENPVGALIYLCAIQFLTNDLKNHRIAFLGDLKFSPIPHSLALLLGMFDVKLSFVTPAALSMPYDISDQVRAAGIEVEETNDLLTTLRKTDVLYLAPIEPARVPPKIYGKFEDFYRIDAVSLEGAKSDLLVLGDWEGAEKILFPTRTVVQEATKAMLAALVEFAVN